MVLVCRAQSAVYYFNNLSVVAEIHTHQFGQRRLKNNVLNIIFDPQYEGHLFKAAD